jgi:mitochondrial fission protein ELM1
LQLIQERAGNTLEAIDICKDILNRTPAAQQLREKIGKLDYIKLKSFCTRKEMVFKLERQPTDWGKTIASYTSEKKTHDKNIQGAQTIHQKTMNQ